MTDAKLEQQAIAESVRITPYKVEWPAQFRSERDRLVGRKKGDITNY